MNDGLLLVVSAQVNDYGQSQGVNGCYFGEGVQTGGYKNAAECDTE